MLLRRPPDRRRLKRPRLRTSRLELLALDADDLDAMIRKDAATLRKRTAAAFPPPFSVPPLLEEDLPRFRDRLRAQPTELGWWMWLAVVRRTREAVGGLGFAGPPGADGAAQLGYAIDPRFQGRGYATEAAGGLAGWALGQPGVRWIRATIPPWNAPSLRVAEKIGMRVVGRSADPELGELLVYGLGEPPAELEESLSR